MMDTILPLVIFQYPLFLSKEIDIVALFYLCLFGLWLNVPVNNFSVISGRFPVFNQH